MVRVGGGSGYGCGDDAGLGGGGGWWEVRRASKDGTISGNPQHQRAGDLRALVINALTDVYFDRGAAPGWKRPAAVLRSNAYLESGADCAFVIGFDEAAYDAALDAFARRSRRYGT